MAAELVLALDECHPMAALGEDGGGLHPGRAAAGHEPARRPIRRGQCPGTESSFPPGARIDGARDRQPLEDAADAALVAADAMDELALASVAHLVRELGVGDLRAGHGDHVRLAAGEDLLGHRRILDAADRKHRQVRQGGLHLRGEVDEIAVGHIRGLDRPEDVVVASRGDVHVVDPPVGLEQLSNPDRVLDLERARNEVAQADPDADDPVVAGTRAHLLDHLACEAESVLERPAVLVLALVVERRQKLMQEVAVRDVHLRAVEAALARELGRVAPPVDHLADVLVLHRLRRLAVSRRLHRGRAPENTEVVRGVTCRIQAEVVQLREDQRAVLMDGRGQPTVGLERFRPVRPGDAWEAGGRGRVDDAVAGDQETGAALRASGLVGDVPLRVDGVVGPELDVGRLHDPVSHLDAANLERTEEVWVGSHRASLRTGLGQNDELAGHALTSGTSACFATRTGHMHPGDYAASGTARSADVSPCPARRQPGAAQRTAISRHERPLRRHDGSEAAWLP